MVDTRSDKRVRQTLVGRKMNGKLAGLREQHKEEINDDAATAYMHNRAISHQGHMRYTPLVATFAMDALRIHVTSARLTCLQPMKP